MHHGLLKALLKLHTFDWFLLVPKSEVGYHGAISRPILVAYNDERDLSLQQLERGGHVTVLLLAKPPLDRPQNEGKAQISSSTVIRDSCALTKVRAGHFVVYLNLVRPGAFWRTFSRSRHSFF
jgi:hypothetical protein